MAEKESRYDRAVAAVTTQRKCPPFVGALRCQWRRDVQLRKHHAPCLLIQNTKFPRRALGQHLECVRTGRCPRPRKATPLQRRRKGSNCGELSDLFVDPASDFHVHVRVSWT